jgi:S1-C subfamily serine protease
MKNIENTTNLVRAGVGAGVVFGARLEALTDAEKSRFRVDHGVKVVEIEDGRFRDLGIRQNYVILSVNGKKVRSATDVRELTGDENTLTSIEGYQSNGTYFNYQFRK